MRKLLYKLVFLLPVPLIIGGTNYYVDPAHLFHYEYYRLAAEHITSGYNVVNLTNIDDRLFQKELVSRFSEPKNVIVLGSSRSLEIGEELFPGKTFFNNSVTGGDLADYLAIYCLYQNADLEPSSILLSIDPWLFNGDFDQGLSQSLSMEYNLQLERIGQINNSSYSSSGKGFAIAKGLELFSATYFQESFRNFNKPELFPSKSKEFKSTIKLSDGTRWYPESERTKKVALINKEARDRLDSKSEVFDKIDIDRMTLFESFLEYLKGRGKDVAIFLPPYHPIVYDQFSVDPQRKIVFQVEEDLKILSDKLNIHCFGSMNPHYLNLEADDFYDGIHLKRDKITEIFKASEPIFRENHD